MLHGRPPRIAHWPNHLILSRLSLRASPHLRTGNASACFTHTSSLGPWILDFGAFDHIFWHWFGTSFPFSTSFLSFILLSNVFRIGLMIEPEKLPVIGSRFIGRTDG
ncbi:hypothetical protein CK203_110599 [Vitis vinifera]|uniref:Uncharacterized protein n=1 Tax=Vitis vinifera TaxID=29760 RepID=A0A438DQC1_VITVI|nr:hypothetical protein CK203_110599 [Vitis vinifera]